MRNVLKLLIAATLMCGPAFAENTSESVATIISELMNYSEPTAQPGTDAATEELAEDVAEEVAELSFLMDEADEAAEGDLDALIEESREAFLGGEYAKAQQGFEEAVKLDPENIMARIYLRTLLERDQRTAELQGLKAVDAAWSTKLVLRSYPLSQDAREQMELGDEAGAVDVQALFPQVDFPKGAQAIYQPKTEILYVRNTTENFLVLEAILDATGVLKDSADVDQVEVEAKFVEVSEGTLEELGFQWNFADPNAVSVSETDIEVNDGPGGLFSDALRGSPSGSSPTLPFDRRVDMGDGTALASGDWSTFRFQDTFNNLPADIGLSYRGEDAFDLLISALDQSSGADVLSAPRVVAQSGEEAIIRVGERHYFPEVFEGDSTQATMLFISYQDFEPTLLGVEMSVTPEVVDGDLIQLGLNPVITELVSWQNYLMAPADSIFNHRQNTPSYGYEHDPVVARLPVFKKRTIETEVIIADGGTIGMGGLISEKIEQFEDKVPVLGSLPLVGRLFRNEGERAVKRNLLMFVTARKVTPSGRFSTSRSFFE